MDDISEKVSEIFNEIQESKNIPNKTIFALQELFEEEHYAFTRALEQCYLKILKFLMDLKSTPKRQIEVFESLTEKLLHNIHQTATTIDNDNCLISDFKGTLKLSTK